jgi:hypothetical protein
MGTEDKSNWEKYGAYIGIAGIIIAILSIFVAVYITQQQDQSEKLNVANSLRMDLFSTCSNNDYFNLVSQNAYQNALIMQTFTPYPIPESFYPNMGMYYSDQNEIAKFKNPQLTAALYLFYDDVIQAEYYRNIVNEKSKIIIDHPSYSPQGFNANLKYLPMINRYFNVSTNQEKTIIMNGIDSNLTDEDNVNIGEGRLAEFYLDTYMLNATQELPNVVSLLSDNNNI